MFEAFSIRARQVVFAARFKAGERGANSIEVEDLLLGLILEDQGMLGDSLFPGEDIFPNEASSHVPIFPQEVAKNLVTRITTLFPRATPVDLSTEIPLSTAAERTFDSSKTFQAQFLHSEIEPLHLWAAILKEKSSPCAKLLQEFEFTAQQVLERLKGH
jgi:ATP-dependent Clp protease ATP-binding subunit ClpA